jgi:ATP-binding cassette subfamily C (CFTR/MRP) protein 4
MTVGHIINLLSNDVQKLDMLFNYLTYIVIGPLHLIIVGILAWHSMGASTLTGLAFMLLGIPLQGAVIWLNLLFYEVIITPFKK